MNRPDGIAPFATVECVTQSIGLFARQNGITGPELAAIFHAAVFTMLRTQPGRIQHGFAYACAAVHAQETGDWRRFWPELASPPESHPPAPRAEAQEVAHG